MRQQHVERQVSRPETENRISRRARLAITAAVIGTGALYALYGLMIYTLLSLFL